MNRPDVGRLLGLATKVLTNQAIERAHGGWIPEKQRVQQQKEAVRTHEKQKKEAEKRSKLQDGGIPDPRLGDLPQSAYDEAHPPYNLGEQLQTGVANIGRIGSHLYESAMEPIRTLTDPIYQGGGVESYTGENTEKMVGAAIPALAGMYGAGALGELGGATSTGAVLRSGMGPVAKETVTQPQRSLSPTGFYSAAAERASLLQPKGDAAQMIAALKNTQGLKVEELMNAGLIDAQGNVHPEWANRGTVTREDLVSHLQNQMPQVEETILQRRSEYPHRTADEWQNAITTAERRGDWDEAERLGIAWEDYEGVGSSAHAGSPPKYEKYTLPGGENYREVLLKLPKKGGKDLETLYKTREDLLRQKSEIEKQMEGMDPFSNEYADAKDKYYQIKRPLNTVEQGIEQLKEQVGGFRSQHWDDPNVLAHIRMADRTGPNGEKILHVEELQSDWGQKGKKEGFKNQAEFDAWKKNHDDAAKEVSDARKQMNDYFNDPSRKPQFIGGKMSPREYEGILNQYRESLEQDPKFLALRDAYRSANQEYIMLQNTKPKYSGIPSAPYVTSTEGWTDLALKRVLKEAAEGGYDKVVWTPGAEQAKRYDLSKQISNVEYFPETQKLRAFDKNGNPSIDTNIVNPKFLADYVGKEIADKLLNSPTKIYESGSGKKVHSVEGLDLQVGGEGMKGYYDSIVPKRLQNLAKKHDKDARLKYADVPNAGSLPSLDITPAMRESILRGQSAYADGGEVTPSDKMMEFSDKFGGEEIMSPLVGTKMGIQPHSHEQFLSQMDIKPDVIPEPVKAEPIAEPIAEPKKDESYVADLLSAANMAKQYGASFLDDLSNILSKEKIQKFAESLPSAEENLQSLKDVAGKIGDFIAPPAYDRGGKVQNLKNGGRVYPLSDREDWKSHQRDPDAKVSHMSPDEFLDKAQKLEDTKENKKDIKHWEKKIEKGKKMGPAALYTDGTQDGRHRVVAAKHMGIKKIPVLTWPERGEETAKDYMKSAQKIARKSSKK